MSNTNKIDSLISVAKRFFPFLLFFLLYLLFENILIEYFKNSFIGKIFFSFHEASLIADLFILLLSIGILAFAIYKGKKRYKLSGGFLAFVLLVILYYFLHRYWPSYNKVLHFEFVKSENIGLRYSDIMFYSLGFGLIIYFIFNLTLGHKKKKIQSELFNSKTSEIGRFLVDHPIEKESDDELGYDGLANQIVKKILNPQQTHHAFTLGINGVWGIGKTSLLNLIELKLNQKKKETKSDHILITFSPLLLSNQNTLTVEFLLQLNSQLKKYSIQSNDHFKRYIYFLTNKVNDLWSALISIFSGDKSSQEQAEILRKIIYKINRQIIVTIDDLDRIDRDEITEVFRLIRNIANLPNLTYIIAYDKKYLCKKLSDSKDSEAEVFLEKFFNAEIVLPRINYLQLREEIYNHCKERIPSIAEDIGIAFRIIESQKQIERDLFDKTLFKDIFEGLILTRRDIIRYINSIIMIPTDILNEVVILEILILEILKLKCQIVYNALKDKVIIEETKSVTYKINKQEFNKLLENDEIINKEHIRTAVGILFGTSFYTGSDVNRKAMVNSDRYDIYFNYLDKSFVRYSEMDKLRKN